MGAMCTHFSLTLPLSSPAHNTERVLFLYRVGNVSRETHTPRQFGTACPMERFTKIHPIKDQSSQHYAYQQVYATHS